MKRLLWLVVVLALATTSAAWSSQPPAENASWTSAEDNAQETARGKLSGYGELQRECEKTFRQITSAVETYVTTVVTVVKAVVNAVRTVVVSVLKIVVRLAFAVALILARWLLSLFFPV